MPEPEPIVEQPNVSDMKKLQLEEKKQQYVNELQFHYRMERRRPERAVVEEGVPLKKRITLSTKQIRTLKGYIAGINKQLGLPQDHGTAESCN